MRAAFYTRQGPAHEVLTVGEVPTPEPAEGEVRVRGRFSGVNRGDTKKRRGWLDSMLPLPRGFARRGRPGRDDHGAPPQGWTASSKCRFPTTSIWTPRWSTTMWSSWPMAPANGRPHRDFWPLLFSNVCIRLIGSDDLSPAGKQRAAAELTAAARSGALRVRTATPVPLADIAEAHERVDAGSRGRILLDLAQP